MRKKKKGTFVYQGPKLEDFIAKEKDWLKYFWLPEENTYWKYEHSKELFQVNEKQASEDIEITTEIPSEVTDYIIEKHLYESEIKEANSCKKIHFKPNNQLKELLDKCFGWSRWAYNESVTIINRWFEKNEIDSEPITLTELRRLVITNNKNLPNIKNEYDNLNFDNQFGLYDLKEQAIIHAHTAYINMINLLKERIENEEDLFEPKLAYRKKKLMKKETFIFYHRHCINKRGLYAEVFKGITFSLTTLSNYKEVTFKHDFTITKTNLGRYYICVPEIKPHVKFSENQGECKIVAIDPGVRTPFACYDPTGKVFKISEHKIYLLYNLARKRAMIISKRDLFKNKAKLYTDCKTEEEKKVHRKYIKKARRVTKVIDRIQNRINNLRNEFHYLTIKYLIERYKIILIPKFSSQQMSDKKTRKIGTQTVRRMHLWGHYDFRMKLIRKAKEAGCLVVFVSESFTTKTCGNCGHLNNVGSLEVLTCDRCQTVLDRDINAARNIFIKYLSKIVSLSYTNN